MTYIEAFGAAALIATCYSYGLFFARGKISPRASHQAFAALALFSAFCFFADAVVRQGRASGVDHAILAFLQSIQSGGLFLFMLSVTRLFDPQNFIVLAALACVLIALMGRMRDAAFVAASCGLAFLLDMNFKLLLHIARPGNPLVPVSGYSFPSGHVTLATAFFLSLCIFFRREVRGHFFRGALVALAFLLAGIVGLSRMYLAAHWFSDVIGGFMLGSFAVALLLPLFDSFLI